MIPARHDIEIGILAAILIIAATACAESYPTEAAVHGVSFSRNVSTPVCHARANGSYQLLHVDAHALSSHRAHGDGVPGEPVPGREGYWFDANCNAVNPGLSGEWSGVYEWDCGGSDTDPLKGTADIHFTLSDPGTGFVSGVAGYRGGTSNLNNGQSYRMEQPKGLPYASGMHVRLTVPAAAGHFVYNEFFGEIAADFSSISGTTLNGDSPVSFSSGCSAVSGPSGTFSITRLP
jgi:hypothetical protein